MTVSNERLQTSFYNEERDTEANVYIRQANEGSGSKLLHLTNTNLILIVN